jgi:hypothetical protein
MKFRFLALWLALVLALATPHHLSAQFGGKTPPGRIQKATLPKTLAELENLSQRSRCQESLGSTIFIFVE